MIWDYPKWDVLEIGHSFLFVKEMKRYGNKIEVTEADSLSHLLQCLKQKL